MSEQKWQHNRTARLIRDRGKCQECGVKCYRPHVHHITPRSEGGGHGIENLKTLCTHCHASEHDTKPCAICGGVLHELEKQWRTLVDEGGGSAIAICDECWDRLVADEKTEGCHTCGECVSSSDGRVGDLYDIPDREERPEMYTVCVDCRKMLVFDKQFRTIKYFDYNSEIDFRHWE